MSELFERIKREVDLLAYIGKRFPSAKMINLGGGSFRVNPAPCCDHNDCFTVYGGDKGFACFSCDAGGDVINLERIAGDHESNLAAAKAIAAREGIEESGGERQIPPGPPLEKGGAQIPPGPPLEKGGDAADERMPGIDSEKAYALRAFAAAVYQKNLLEDAEALARQTEGRKHPYDLLVTEEIGYAKNNLIAAAERAGYSPDDLAGVGLVNRYKNGWRETIRPGSYVYPHKIGNRIAYFTIKVPKGCNEYQIRKVFRPESWICLGQDVLERKTLHICEGENDRLSLLAAGATAVVATNGNLSRRTLLPWIRENAGGKKVYLWFDNDVVKEGSKQKEPAGRKYDREYSAAALAAGAEVYSGIDLLPEGADIDDVLRDADDKTAAFRDLMDRAELREKGGNGGPPDDGGSCSFDCTFGSFDVLGELPNGNLIFWSREKQCNYSVRLKDLTLDQLVQIGGSEVARRVCRTLAEAEADPGRVLFSTAKRNLIIQAGKNRIAKPDRFGQGIHAVDDGHMILVNGGAAWIWDGKKFTLHDYPLYNGRFLIDFMPGAEWLDSNRLQQTAADMDMTAGRKLVGDLLDLYRQWGFQNRYDVELMAGFVLAQIVQTFWEWRPHLWLTGGSGTGKTKLHQLNQALLGELMLFSAGRLTEPGFRQSIGANALCPYIDEFENSPDRKKIIDLLRSSGRGGTSRMGTTHGEAISFSLKHMVFVSSIEVGLERSAENSRFLVVHTKRDNTRKPRLPNTAAALDLRHRMTAFALKAAPRAKSLILDVLGQIDRADESLAVPLSMLEVVSDQRDKKKALVDSVRRYREEWEKWNGGDMVEDEDRLLSAILDSNIRLPRPYTNSDGNERTQVVEISIADAIFGKSFDDNWHIWRNDIEAKGIKRTYDDGAVFLYPAAIERYLLKGTVWDGLKIKEILKRIDGAEWTKYPIAKGRPYGVMVPYDYFERHDLVSLDGEVA